MLIDYYYLLLDGQENEIGILEGVQRGSGRITFSSAASVKSKASLTLTPTGQFDDWLQIRIQPWVRIGGDEWPLGVFLPNIPSTSYRTVGETSSVQLLDKANILARDWYGSTFGAPEGTVITKKVREIIQSTGEPPGAITEDDSTLLTSSEWSPEFSKLQIVNEMLEAGNYFSLWTDGYGQFQVSPWQRPARRPVSAHFLDGHGAEVVSYTPDFTRTHDVGKVPNVYIARTQGDDENESLGSEAVNMDPDDPFSIPNRGFRVLPEAGPDLDVKTTSQEALDEYAARRLIESSQPQETVVINHLPMRFSINDAVRFESRRFDIDGLFTVQKQEWTLSFDGLVTSTLRRVVDI